MAEESVVTMWASMASWFTPTSLFLFLNLVIGTIALSSRFTSQKNPNQQPRDNPTQQLFRASSSMLERLKSINFSVYRSESSESATILQHSEQSEQTQYTNSNDGTHQLAQAPSILQRVKSFNFSFHRYQQSEAAQETQYQNLNTGPDSDDDTDNPAVTAELELYREVEQQAKMKKSVSEKPETKVNSGAASAKMTKAKSSEASAKMTKAKSSEAPLKMTKSASEKLRFWRAAEDEEEEEEEIVERRRPATVRDEKTVTSGDGECVNEKADDFINRFRNQLKLQRLDSMLRYKEMITRGSSR